MKKILLIAMAALFIPSGSVTISSTPPANNLQATDAISTIRRRYAAINKNLAQYKVVKKELAGFSTEGGELTAYFDGATIVKIAATFNGETNSFFEEFYYSNGKLIFVYRKQEIYDEPMTKVVKTKENRFYFNDGELIKWINENGKQVAASNSKYTARQIHYLGNSKLFTDGILSPNPIIEAPERNP
jgi:serine/threonine-protein kinase